MYRVLRWASRVCVCVSSPYICHETPPIHGAAVIPIKRRKRTDFDRHHKRHSSRIDLLSFLFFFSFPSAVSVNPHSAARLFNCCLSLTRVQRHSGGLSYSAGATLALKWNDLISQLSIVKDIYKRLRLQAQRYDRWSRGGVVVVVGQSSHVASFGGWE